MDVSQSVLNIGVLLDDLVSHILSHLSTKQAIRTSILSKRWRNLWTNISNIDFAEVREPSPRCKDYHKSLKKRIETVLLRPDHGDCINKLSISLAAHCIEKIPAEKLISSVVEHNVKDLNLSMFYYSPDCVELPRNVFDSKSLEALRLSYDLQLKIPIPKPGFVCFPNLKFLCLEHLSISGLPDEENFPCFPKLVTLCLKWVQYEGKDDSVMKLIRNCPILKDLSITRTLCENASNSDMCIPQLTTADLYCIQKKGVRFNVQIEAPIKYLTISDWDWTSTIIVRNRDSLVRAKLSPKHGKYYHKGQHWDELFETVEKVKYLSLAFPAIDAIKFNDIKLPLFSNLIRLETWAQCEDLCMLECLLNSTINLQVLVISKVCGPCQCDDRRKDGSRIEDDRWWKELSNVPKCLLTSLKRVEIISSTACRVEIEMMKNMLNFAKVLEKLIAKHLRSTYTKYERKTMDTLRQKVSTFPRASSSCQLDLFIND